jgi:hypothetical protein
MLRPAVADTYSLHLVLPFRNCEGYPFLSEPGEVSDQQLRFAGNRLSLEEQFRFVLA